MFENILGNEKIKKELQTAVSLNKNSHSYLFVGTSGIGKKMIAMEFAKMILCIDANKYCNYCKSCLQFDSNNNPDFILIKPDGASIKIEQIREMQKKFIEAPIFSSKKVYIIDDADLMTKEAQNCLLKTLEEPPEFVTIILIGANENSFLSTIKSRCTILKFDNISDEILKKYLSERYQLYDVSENMMEAFQGSIGRAEMLKDKSELYDSIYQIITHIDKINLIELLKKAEIIYKSQEDKYEILDYINIILYRYSKENIKYVNCINIVEDTKKRLKANSNYNMCIDDMLFKIWEEINCKI